MEFRFLHAADLHLDSPLHGLAQYEGVPVDVVRTATRAALDNLVSCAIEAKVAFVVIAGDLYDGDWEAFPTGLYFCSAMRRLDAAGIQVFLLYGNHDADSRLTQSLPLPPNVAAFSADRPETLEHLGTGTRLHGQSYKTRDPGPLAGGYPAACAGAFNIGVLHTALTGAAGHAPYAPCHPDELAAKGYDYWALGHVHGFAVIRRAPHIVFPGNLQGRNVRETGPKGAALVTVADGQVVQVDHVPLDAVRWSVVELDLTDIATEASAHERIRQGLSRALAAEADGRPMVARVRAVGETPLHGNLLEAREVWREAVRAIAASLSDSLWIEKFVPAVRPPPGEAALTDEFETLLRELSADPALSKAIAGDLAEFLSKAPADLDQEAEGLAAARTGDLAPALEAAAAALRIRLVKEASS